MTILKGYGKLAGNSYNTDTGEQTNNSGVKKTISSSAPSDVLTPAEKANVIKSTNEELAKLGIASPFSKEFTGENTESVDTSKSSASPMSYKIQQGDTLSKLAQTGGVNVSDILSANPNITDPNKIQAGGTLNLPSKYKQAFEQTKTSGVTPPPTQGGANSFIQQATGGATVEEPSPITGILDTDKNFDNILTSFDDFYSPVKQRQTLLQEYQSMEKSLGIQALNQELIDSKRIIEGTEDDIRSEVIAAGGFATDSQVLAMANARNKSLVKNYNYLLETRDSAMTQLNTMMNLSIQDRQMAEKEFDTKLNFAFKVKEFQQKATDNAISGLNKIVENVGYAGLLASTNGNAYEQSLIEKTLGLGAGGLQKLAAQPDLDRQMKQAQLETERLQQANIRSQISDRGKENVKPATQAQLKVAGYKDRLIEANQIINGIGSQFTGVESYLGKIAPNFLKGENRQLYEQAQRNFINAVLRQESGAAIGKDEFKNAEKQYFPQPGDSDNVIRQKANNRQTVINSFTREAGSNSTNILIAPDGQEIEIID